MFCESCVPEIVFVLISTLAEQFNVHKSYKTCESTLSCIGHFEENVDLSHIHLAVLVKEKMIANLEHKEQHFIIKRLFLQKGFHPHRELGDI